MSSAAAVTFFPPLSLSLFGMASGGGDGGRGEGEPARAPKRVVFAAEVEVPNALQRLKLAMRDPAFHTKKLTLWFRTAQVVFGLTAVILSTAYDLPRYARAQPSHRPRPKLSPSASRQPNAR